MLLVSLLILVLVGDSAALILFPSFHCCNDRVVFLF